MAENFNGPYSREIEYIDKIADILLGPDDLIHNVGDRRTFALQRLLEFVVREGSGAYRNVQADWNADPDSESAILNKPDGIPVDPDYVHTEENFSTFHRDKLENIEAFAQHNVQSDWTEEDTSSDAYIRNVPDDIVQDANYVHTDFNFDEHYKNMLDYHVITDDYFTPEDSDKLDSIEWNATHTDIDDEVTPDSTNPVESRVLFYELEGKVDKREGYELSANDFTDELKAKLDAIEPEANKIIVDSELINDSTNPVENQIVCEALDTKVDKAEDQSLMTKAERLKLEGIEEQANRTIPDENITANSHNVVESRAIYEALDTKVNKVNGKGLSTNDFTDALKSKLDDIDYNANNTIVDPQITRESVNPVTSNAIYNALDTKVDKEDGYGLFSDEEKEKLRKFDPEAPKVTITDLVFNTSSGEYDMLSLTWNECKAAISNGILYRKASEEDAQKATFCYSVYEEDGVYRVEFASFTEQRYEFFETDAPNKRPVFEGSENIRSDLSGKVDKTTKVNGHTLDQDVSVTPNDIEYSSSRPYDSGTVGGALNWLRTYKADKGTLINGHSLENDVTITPNDIAFDHEDNFLEGSIGKFAKDVSDHVDQLNETFEGVATDLDDRKVDKTTTVNGHALDQNVTVGAGDVPYSSDSSFNAGTVGKELKNLAEADESLDSRKADKTTTVNGHPLSGNVDVAPGDIGYDGTANYAEGSLGKHIKELDAESAGLSDGKVDKTTTVNGHALDQNVVISPNDIVYDREETFDPDTLGEALNILEETGRALGNDKVDKTTTVNGHALSNDVVVGAGDIEFQDGTFYPNGSLGEKVYVLNRDKVDKVAGKWLSQEDFTTLEKEKLAGIDAQATRVIVDSDLSGSSTNPVQNQAVTGEINGVKATIEDIVISSDNQPDSIYNKIWIDENAPSVQIATYEELLDLATEVDRKLTSIYRLKGTKATVEQLPEEDNSVGDVWHVSSDGSEYFWNGTSWEFVGKIVDLAGYVYDTSYVHTDSNFTVSEKTKLSSIEPEANKTIVDVSLSDSSKNPVENRVVRAALNDKVDKVSGKGLSTNDFTNEDVLKLAGIESEANKTVVDSELSDESTNPVYNKTVKHAVDEKVDKIPGKGLSANDFDDSAKEKVESVETGAQVNVLEKIVINGTRLAISDKTVSFSIPTKTSDITNDSDFITHDVLTSDNPLVDGVATSGVSNEFARADHVHPTDTSRAPVESPTFTGIPKAATAEKGTNSTQLATTAFVQTAISDKANASDVYTKQQVDNKVTAVYRLKGSKPDFDHLPEEDNVTGDVWHINSDGSEYFWNGEAWEFFGKTVDLTGYAYDPDYVHTDNNYTASEKSKLANVEAEANKTIVDSTMSSSSTNPVENRVVNAAIEGKVDKITGKGLSTEDFTTEEKTKLGQIEPEANKTIVDTQLSADSHNPIENRSVKLGLDEKVDKVPGKALSTNDFTDALKEKLDGSESGAQENVIETISVNGARQANVDKNVNLAVPTKVSDLTNDSEFLARSEFYAVTPEMDGTGTPGTSNTVARGDHVHPTDTTRAPIDSPSFSGTPKAATPPKSDSSTRLATTYYVQRALEDKANASDVYTKQQVDSKITAVYRLKGTKPDYAHLPVLQNEVGDVWHLEFDGTEYFWNGESWEFFGKIVDLTGYVYDPNYVHTDNNFTDALKGKIDGLGANDVIATEDYVDNAVADKALASSVYTKTEVDDKFEIVFRYKGIKQHIADLHYNANEIGDVWTVLSEEWDFYWTGTEWKRVGGFTDLTGYVRDANYVHTDNNFTSELMTKLDNIVTGSLVNVQADWSASGGEEEVLNKPLINNVELVSGNNTWQSLGLDIASEQSIDALFN